MDTTVATEVIQPQQTDATPSSGLTPEQQVVEQQARDRYNKSINPEVDVDPTAVPEGYNPDGTPIEEEIS